MPIFTGVSKNSKVTVVGSEALPDQTKGIIDAWVLLATYRYLFGHLQALVGRVGKNGPSHFPEI